MNDSAPGPRDWKVRGPGGAPLQVNAWGPGSERLHDMRNWLAAIESFITGESGPGLPSGIRAIIVTIGSGDWRAASEPPARNIHGRRHS